ncbi:MAG: DNA-protecting protein DprA [Fluviicola sp.]|nr:MAG: DNA-protecting protein DprA [Fluviicola sp.]
MDYTYLHYRIALTLLHRVGPKKARKLLESLTCKQLFTLCASDLRRKTGVSASFIEKMGRKEALHTSEGIVSFIEKHQINTIFYTDEGYPKRLSECPDAPLLLYQKGQESLAYDHWVAIVGTRNATSYGKSICRELIQSFQGKGIVVVSGLALGIDSYVHEYCLEFDVPTIAVLGHGLDRIYPHKNRDLAKSIIHSGSLITEFPPNTLPDRENFPKRNRIVAGLCDATIVIESNTKGGSLITADLANGYNRDVFAYPGNIFQASSHGCNDLIRSNKAHLIASSKDFLALMEWNTAHTPQKEIVVQHDLSPIQQEIATAIGTSTVHIDELAEKTRLSLSTLNVELFDLLMSGALNELPGKRFVMA